MTRIPATSDLALVRQVMFRRLRDSLNALPQNQWRQLEDDNGQGFQNYVEWSPRADAEPFLRAVVDVFWQLVVEGILAPGISMNSHGQNLPWFHVTEYGRKVIAQGEYQPHDRDGYLRRLSTRNTKVDPTMLAYLEESLETFTRGNRVASMVMLGVAAERVFDLLCESLLSSSAMSAKEKATLEDHMRRARLKPRLEYVHQKLTTLQSANTPGFPESAALMVTAMYDIIRAQRNDLGHPQEKPPLLDADVANARLQMFAGYFETAEQVRHFLGHCEAT
jgi:hypothetical protein